jgi:hypothetical protein
LLLRLGTGTGLSKSVSSSNNSAAFPVNAGPDPVGDVRGKAMFTGDAVVVVVEESRNGFRDVGLGGGSWGDRWVEEDIAGEAARFRKGLFDDRLIESEGDRLPSCGWIELNDILAIMTLNPGIKLFVINLGLGELKVDQGMR